MKGHILTIWINTLKRIIFVCLLSIHVSTIDASEPKIKIHYLGHSAFVLEFDNGMTVVTDYGHFNAWAEWGWDSPIHDIGDLVPDIMTYSHRHHDDHYDPDRIPDGVRYILKDTDSLTIGGLEIRPIRTCEQSVDSADNTSFLFIYKGLRLLHLGDAQAQIENIQNGEVRTHITKILPNSVDMLLMTVQGVNKFIPQAEAFIDLLQPKRVIPMHYWSQEYREDFLQYLEKQNSAGKHYDVHRLDGAKTMLSRDEPVTPITVISLKRAPFRSSIETE
jgi:L-ascorbate metabolism protein UlaG (beta-lactamase superfamily)